MGSRLLALSALIAVLAAGVLSLVAPIQGQGGNSAGRRPIAAKHDLSGIWPALNTANFDLLDHSAQAGPAIAQIGAIGAVPPGQGVVDGNEIPYKPEAIAKKNANFEKRRTDD